MSFRAPQSPAAAPQTAGDGNELADLRLQTLRRRWLLTAGEELPRNDVDLSLLTQPIPADSFQTKRLLKRLEKGAEAVQPRRQSTRALLEWQTKLRRNKMRRRARSVDDHDLLLRYVTAPPVPTFKRLISTVIAWFAPRSKLAPVREEKPESDEIDRGKLTEAKGNSQIVVHVMKATNLPIREDGTPLEPFVEVRFVHESAATRVESGCSPSWFETLFLDFEPPDFDEDTLSSIDDEIIVSFYDQVRMEMPYTYQSQGGEGHVTHYRTERRLIGQVKLPFYTLFDSPGASVEGLFSVHSARWVMGYRYPPTEEEAPSVNLYFSLFPPLRKKELPPPSVQEVMAQVSLLPVTRGLHVLHQAAGTWQVRGQKLIDHVAALNPLAGRRELQPFVANSKGDPTLICRYLTPTGSNPPAGLRTAANAIRFVSLIPFVVDIMAWSEDENGGEARKDVWRTNAEYLEMGLGDYEEMALLLVHYLRHLEPASQAYLLLGEGDIFKQATFVLYGVPAATGVEWRVIDPRLGEVFSTANPRCGLTEVSCVVSHNQVWANIQMSGSPYRMCWNLQDRRDWLPMFDDRLAEYLPQLDSIQRPVLQYSAPVPDDDIALADALKRKVKKQLKAWRNGASPIFQERVGTILKELLVEMESERLEWGGHRQQSVDVAHDAAAGEFGGEYIAVGNPINSCYRPDDGEDFTTLLDRVEETAVHEVGTEAVRFAVAAYVRSYTKEVKSVWVYLVALLPRDSIRRTA